MQISNRIQHVAESGSLKMAARAKEMQAQGIDIISLTLGEPDFAAPDNVKKAAIDAVAADWSHYGPVPGYPSLRQAIVHYLPQSAGFDADDIVVSAGAKQSLYNSVMCVMNAGDEAIIPTPSWVSYGEMVKLADGVPVIIPTKPENGWKLTTDQLEQHITDRTRLIILCSPNNPTGSVYNRRELDALVDVLRRHPNIVVLSDEIYQKILYVDEYVSMAEYADILDRTIIINGVSKAYAMTGYRIGWLASKNKELVKAVKKLQGQSTTCACTVAQRAAEEGYIGNQACVELMRIEYAHRKEMIMKLLGDIPHIRCTEPQGAFYVFPDVSDYYPALGRWMKAHGVEAEIGSAAMTEYLLTEAHVACVSGADFGEDRCIRLSYATSRDNIREAIRRIREALILLTK